MVWYFWCPPPVDLFLVFSVRCKVGGDVILLKLTTEEEPYLQKCTFTLPAAPVSRIYFGIRSTYESVLLTPTKDPGTDPGTLTSSEFTPSPLTF